MATLHQLTRRNLDAARGSLSTLEAQVGAAKALVHSLEHQLILIESAAQLADIQRHSDGGGLNQTNESGGIRGGVDLALVRCGVCLDISRAKIFQCSQGTIPTTLSRYRHGTYWRL